jgi:hypothetical protein
MAYLEESDADAGNGDAIDKQAIEGQFTSHHEFNSRPTLTSTTGNTSCL